MNYNAFWGYKREEQEDAQAAFPCSLIGCILRKLVPILQFDIVKGNPERADSGPCKLRHILIVNPTSIYSVVKLQVTGFCTFAKVICKGCQVRGIQYIYPAGESFALDHSAR